MPASALRGASRLLALSLVLGLAFAACTPIGADAPWRAAAIAWQDVPGERDAVCPAFDAVAPGGDGWWLAGPGCLIRAAADERLAAIYPFAEGEWGMDRVDGLLAASDGSVWATGRQRYDDAVRAVLGRFLAGEGSLGSPARWQLDSALINAFAAAPDGTPWAVGRRLGAEGGLLVARWRDGHWQTLDTGGLARGELLDIDFAADGCAWMVGRDAGGGGFLVRFDGKRLLQERLGPEDGVPKRVLATSCGDVWLAGTSVVRYAHGHREEIGFGGAELSGIAVCPDGDLLLVGERTAHEPEMRGRHVGFAFQARDGAVTPMPVPLPFVVGDWRLADVGCDASGAWAVGSAIVRFAGGATAKRALVYRLGADGWEYRGWQVR